MKKLLVIPASIAVIFLGGCNIFGPRSGWLEAIDGAAGTMSSELGSMGAAVEDGLSGSSGLAKTAVAVVDTKYVDIVIQKWTYDSVNGYWTRSSTATYDNNVVRVRADTVWLYSDATRLHLTRRWSVDSVAAYTHHRSTYFQGAVNTFNVVFTMNVAINKPANADTQFVYNGQSVGTMNGEPNRTTTISNVVRAWHWNNGLRPHLSFPDAGTVNIDRLRWTVDIEFTGNGSATATATRKSDGKSTTFIINVQSGNET
jgi:hypothetical protein